MKYVIKKRNKTFKVKKFDLPFKGYKFKPKITNVKNIIVIDNKLQEKIILKKINTMFTRLLMIVNDILSSDDENPSGVVIALDEISLIRGQLITKYNKYLSEIKIALYLKKLGLIQGEVEMKLYSMKEKYIFQQMSSRGR